MSQNKEIIAVKNLNNNSIEEILRTQESVSPSSDIYENPDEFILVANMPGVSRNEIQVKVINDSLNIFGKINYDEAVSRDYILNENEIGNYFRKFKISDAIDKTKINAKYDNGQLMVTLPKLEKAKPRKIEIL
ncbi:MAG: Hsp20/alpha crystallin family protein [Ignavibacteriaceae bacterium]|jgi:HSP20 family protein|nr:Hsp20/alpha crystallin family protein [Ignavibacteriaceae bacterium]MCW8816697.1 Hsp20/alpha crystallin family protein [Ignavibacteriaceae bacterium]MCW8823498.1 Hsp20/alpha crystallin family protein [Ignavibacteriaceae bacterium]MCW9094332.1 Hsp20/alpha crystallin family protein [Ignavibacteriaceae bacterium]MCW9096363.1 Hsp20/alpha crystallin family protein [Ignavibacteriaceae bacterium]